MRLSLVAAAAIGALSLAAAPQAGAQQPKLVLAMSGWTGFAPLTLAEKAGLFKKHGVDVEIKFVAQMQRHLAVASGDVQAVATTVDTQIAYTAAGVTLTQVLVLDKSNGGDGIAAVPAIASVAGLKGKRIAVDGPGTTPYFMLAYVLRRNNMTPKDVTAVTLKPQDAANAFIAGQFEAAVTYEPYLSNVRAMGADKGKILATTVDYPVVVDTLSFPPDFIRAKPEQVRGVVAGFFDALEMIKTEPAKSYEIMGARVNMDGAKFEASAKFIQWQDRAANQAYFAKEMAEFMTYAAEIQSDAGVIKTTPNLAAMVDPSFVK